MRENKPKRRTLLRDLLLLPAGFGIVHLAVTFFAMSDSRASAYARLSNGLAVNKMMVLGAIQPNAQPLPFWGAGALYALCRFDAKQGPVDVSVTLAGLGWTLGIYNQDGTAAYFAAGNTNKADSITITILPGTDKFLGLTPQALGKQTAAEPRATVSAQKGLIVVRAPDKGAAYTTETVQALALAACTQRAY